MSRRVDSSARKRARAARAALEAKRREHEKLVDAQVVAYYTALDELEDAQAALDSAEEKAAEILAKAQAEAQKVREDAAAGLARAQRQRIEQLGAVLEVEPHTDIVKELTGADLKDINKARKARKASRSKKAEASQETAPSETAATTAEEPPTETVNTQTEVAAPAPVQAATVTAVSRETTRSVAVA
ncbi:hypothetical protein GZ176_11740 [Dermatophilus congolensis]|uniref:hypothetical protein n=1 Tax=Dermatophilus congolensis TaxID=1863 RepID=UPI001AAE6955|nr:hypothetical protein [Dermatophilus congolensis]MBO3146354.1 hypothetical protein [Dermatophilus congolensis]MBO3148603.1 hypothetical protein [Dermatophilus congolensis]MBO3157591.1 hypothetical protein [Dermatophilus congolensis]MBO3159871.1 hypothetical protein [Dermatophilus congolensis]MBO3166610.1 hypothetical protein [Dermatophilus congolensis]